MDWILLGEIREISWAAEGKGSQEGIAERSLEGSERWLRGGRERKELMLLVSVSQFAPMMTAASAWTISLDSLESVFFCFWSVS